ncbi:MAG: hypothetical protein WC054_00975 [Candidatus Nanopelagicales bacterium]
MSDYSGFTVRECAVALIESYFPPDYLTADLRLQSADALLDELIEQGLIKLLG